MNALLWTEPHRHDWLPARSRILHLLGFLEAWQERVCAECGESELLSGPVRLGVMG